MNQHFVHLQACIRKLEACPSSLSTSYPTLDFGFHWMRSPCIWEESFSSRSAAAQDAERAFLPLYHQAEEALRRCWAPSSPDGLYSEFCRTVNCRLGEAQEALIPMRTQRTAPVLNRICDVALSLSDEELKGLSWTTFVTGCTQLELIQYLKERRLYINEPISQEEEV